MNARGTRRPHARRAYSRSVTPTMRTGGGGGGNKGGGCGPFRAGCLAWLLILGGLAWVATDIADKAATP